MSLISLLQKAESDLPSMLENVDLWNTLDVDYFPPRVERLWTQYDEKHRLYIHYIHPTTEDCLFHKHRWQAAFKMLKGCYEMGITSCKDEIKSEQAYDLPIIAKFILNEGSYYEMCYTHSMHYVKPLGNPSLSLMLTGELYTEERKEAPHPPLNILTEERKLILIDLAKNCLI